MCHNVTNNTRALMTQVWRPIIQQEGLKFMKSELQPHGMQTAI